MAVAPEFTSTFASLGLDGSKPTEGGRFLCGNSEDEDEDVVVVASATANPENRQNNQN